MHFTASHILVFLGTAYVFENHRNGWSLIRAYSPSVSLVYGVVRCSNWRRAMTMPSSEGSEREVAGGAGGGAAWPPVASAGVGTAAAAAAPDDEGLMLGVLAALRSPALSADEQQRRLNAMIVELQQLRRNLETSSSSASSSASLFSYHNSPVCLRRCLQVRLDSISVQLRFDRRSTPIGLQFCELCCLFASVRIQHKLTLTTTNSV